MTEDSINSIQAGPHQISKKQAIMRRLTLLTMGIKSNTDLSKLTYLIFVLVDFLQQIAIIINGNFYSQWQGTQFTYLKQILTFLSFQNLIKNYQQIFLVLLLTCTIIFLFLIILVIILLRNSSQLHNTSQVYRIANKSLAMVFIGLRTVFVVPFFYVLIGAFLYNGDRGNARIFVGLGCLFGLFGVPLGMYSVFILSDFNPFSSVFYAGQTHYSRLWVIIIKFILVLYSFLDPEHKIQLHMLIVLLLLKTSLTIINHIFPSQQQYNKSIRIFKIWLEYILIWYILFMIICKYSSSSQQLYFYFFTICLLCLVFIFYVQNNMEIGVLYQKFIVLEKTSQIELHVFKLVELADSLKDRASRILMEGYIAFHARNCNLPGQTCPCKQIIFHDEFQLQSRKFLYYQFIVSLIKTSINKATIPRRIYLLLSFIYHSRLNNKFQSIAYLLLAKQESTNIIQKIQCQCQLKLIQSQLDQNQHKRNSNVSVDVIKFLQFNMKIVQFQQLLDSCAINHIEFWNQILEVNLNIQKLENCGSVIARQKEAVKNYFHGLLELNGNNAHVMIIYGQFLAWVCNQDFEHAKLIEKGTSILKNLKQSSKINGKNQKYSQNSRTSIIIISCNQDDIGTIIQTNNYIKEMSGYNRKQLIQKNISMLMPKVIAQHHDLSLTNFLRTSKQKYTGIQRIVTVLTRDKYIVPALAFTKQIPNLENGIYIAGFLSPYDHIEEDDQVNDKIGYILYDTNSQIIMGLSQICHVQYGIPKCLVYGNSDNMSNQLKMKHIFGVSIDKNDRGLQKQKQIVAVIDNKTLRDQFVISNQNSTKRLIQDNTVQLQIKVQVLIRSVYQLLYHNIPLRLIAISKDFDKKQDNEIRRKSIKQTNMDLHKQERSDSKSQSDDLKNLKDFKNFISVKRQPKAIRFIKYACLVLVVIFFFGAGGFIVLHIQELEVISSTMQGIKLAFLNRMYLTELSFQADKIFINYSDAYPAGELFPELQAIKKMNQILQSAKQCQMQLLPIKNYLSVKKVFIDYFNFFPNGTYNTTPTSIDQAITIQLSKLYHITNTNGTYFKSYPLDYNSLTVSNYLQVKYTQIFSFIRACNQIQQLITDEGKNKNQTTKLYLIVLSAVLVFFLIVWVSVSLPKTINVVEINSKVLSLFNFISPEDVRGVVNKCYVFRTRYLVEAEVDKKKMADLSREVSKQLKVMQQIPKRKNTLTSQSNANTKSGFKQSPLSSLNASYLQTSSRVIMTTQAKPKQIANNDNFQDYQKQNTLIDKDNKDKTRAIITYFFIFLFLASYIGFTCGYLIINYSQFVTETKTMSVLYNRAAQFQEIKSVYTKYLTDRSLSYQGATVGTINLQLITKIYDTERSLVVFGTSSQQYSDISSLNTQNVCDEIKTFQDFKIWGKKQLSVKQCQSVDNGILMRGVKTTLVTIMQQIRAMILLPQSQKAKMNTYVETVSVIQRYTILQKYIVRPMMMISSNIAASKTKKQLNINMAFYCINGFFLILILLFWKFAWQKYLQYLNENVWRTKSMLNVIPSKIITNNQSLMRQFTSGQLQKIVK